MSSNSADLEPGRVARERAALIRETIEAESRALWRTIAVLLPRVWGPMSREAIAGHADEVMGEIALRALENAGNLQPGRPALPWLVGIAKHVLQGRRRETVRRPPAILRTDLGEDAWERVLEGLYAGSTDGAGSARLDLEQTMGRLDPAARTALEARYFHGLDGDALARALGAPSSNAAKVRVHRALQELRHLVVNDSEVGR